VGRLYNYESKISKFVNLLKRAALKPFNYSIRIRRLIHTFQHPCKNSQPVFIVGFGSSGKSMTVETFTLSLDATVYYQTDNSAFDGHRFRNDRALTEHIARSKTAVTVFNCSHELQKTSYYLRLLPNLKVIWLLRSFKDAAAVCAKRWKAVLIYFHKILTEPSKSEWWCQGLSQTSIDLVRTYYHPNMSVTSAYALFWYIRNNLYFEFSLEREPNVKIFRYEDLTSSPIKFFSKMYEFCNCPFNERLTRRVVLTPRENPDIEPSIKKLCQDLTDRFNGELSARG